MQNQGTGSRPLRPEDDLETVEGEITATLLSGSGQQVWTSDELAREVADDPAEFPLALRRLRKAGLVNVCGEIVFAARAARRAEQVIE